MRRTVFAVIGLVIVAFVVIQFIPGPARSNPPVQYHVNWNSEETATLVQETCYDCHSNETVWPWYSQIAPMSWLVARDVNEGRAVLNFSERSGEMEGGELIGVIQEGEMPPASYLVLHPNARLDSAQKSELIAGIQATLGGAGGEENEAEEGE